MGRGKFNRGKPTQPNPTHTKDFPSSINTLTFIRSTRDFPHFPIEMHMYLGRLANFTSFFLHPHRSMASRPMVPADQRRRLRLVAPHLPRSLLPCRAGRRSDPADHELDVSDLRRRHDPRHGVLRRQREDVVQGPAHQRRAYARREGPRRSRRG